MPLIGSDGIKKSGAAPALELSSDSKITAALGDNAGANEFEIINTTPDVLFKVFSDGAACLNGDLTVNGDLILAGGSSNVKLYILFAEENSALNNNSFEWSFGNGSGSVNLGFVPDRPGKALGMSIKIDSPPTSTCVVEIQRRLISNNGFLDSRSLSIGSGLNGNSISFATAMSFTASDYLVFRTVTSGNAQRAVIAATLEFD